MIAESGDMRRCRWILCVGGTQKDIFIAEKTDCSRIGNYDADGLQLFCIYGLIAFLCNLPTQNF